MKNIKIALWTLFSGLTLLWLLADSVLPQPMSYFALRTPAVQYTGLMALAAMSVAMILAARPRRVEPLLGGLDKMYWLHKWLGIGSLCFGCLHWVWAKGTKWAVGWGWLIKPAKSSATSAQLGAIEQWLHNQRGLAETLGEWTFYLGAGLIILALVKRLPYHWFAKTHRVLPALYLVLVAHSVVLMKFSYWSEPIGMLSALLMLAGSWAAWQSLGSRIGVRRKVHGVIHSLIEYPQLRALESHIALQPGWPGHQTGQFAFVTLRKGEAAHPYTIASAWQPEEARLSFVIKALGDHTRQLPQILRVGDPVTVEGPYGGFTFEDQKPRQIWIGAGIGITPFLARLQHLALTRDGQQQIDLYHPCAEYSAQAMENLRAAATAAGVRLHVLVSGQHGRLSAARLRREIPDWRTASLWFCGPAHFAQCLREDLLAHGLQSADFHQELFQMR